MPMTVADFSGARAQPGVLNRAAIAALIDGGDAGGDAGGDGGSDGPGGPAPLVSGYVDLAEQLQPNGFDLTLGQVAQFAGADGSGGDAGGAGAGRLGVSGADRELPSTRPLPGTDGDWWHLRPGAYLATFNEIVSLPLNLMALCRPRSTLLRSGVSLHTGVWDAGYCGQGQALVTVHHPGGWRAQRNARIAQLVFLPLAEADAHGYAGVYQHDGIYQYAGVRPGVQPGENREGMR